VCVYVCVRACARVCANCRQILQRFVLLQHHMKHFHPILTRHDAVARFTRRDPSLSEKIRSFSRENEDISVAKVYPSRLAAINIDIHPRNIGAHIDNIIRYLLKCWIFQEKKSKRRVKIDESWRVSIRRGTDMTKVNIFQSIYHRRVRKYRYYRL